MVGTPTIMSAKICSPVRERALTTKARASEHTSLSGDVHFSVVSHHLPAGNLKIGRHTPLIGWKLHDVAV